MNLCTRNSRHLNPDAQHRAKHESVWPLGAHQLQYGNSCVILTCLLYAGTASEGCCCRGELL